MRKSLWPCLFLVLGILGGLGAGHALWKPPAGGLILTTFTIASPSPAAKAGRDGDLVFQHGGYEILRFRGDGVALLRSASVVSVDVGALALLNWIRSLPLSFELEESDVGLTVLPMSSLGDIAFFTGANEQVRLDPCGNVFVRGELWGNDLEAYHRLRLWLLLECHYVGPHGEGKILGGTKGTINMRSGVGGTALEGGGIGGSCVFTENRTRPDPHHPLVEIVAPGTVVAQAWSNGGQVYLEADPIACPCELHVYWTTEAGRTDWLFFPDGTVRIEGVQ